MRAVRFDHSLTEAPWFIEIPDIITVHYIDHDARSTVHANLINDSLLYYTRTSLYIYFLAQGIQSDVCIQEDEK